LRGKGHTWDPRNQRPELWNLFNTRIRLGESDVFTATVGGMRIVEPAADLAVALAVASAAKDFVLPPDVVVLGEVGLAGEVRRVSGVRTRLAEAARLGFTRALVPPDAGRIPEGVRAHVVPDLGSALNLMLDSVL